METYLVGSYDHSDITISEHRRVVLLDIIRIIQRDREIKVHTPMFSMNGEYPNEPFELIVIIFDALSAIDPVQAVIQNALAVGAELMYKSPSDFGLSGNPPRVEPPSEETLIPGSIAYQRKMMDEDLSKLPLVSKPISFLTLDEMSHSPKHEFATNKLPLHLWPASATMMGCIGLLNGALKYGRSNFRVDGILASEYVDACRRHLDAWFEGEEKDPDDGVPHLSAVLATVAIIVEAIAAGTFIDDRQIKGGYREIRDELTTHVARLKELHKDKNPKHYNIGGV